MFCYRLRDSVSAWPKEDKFDLKGKKIRFSVSNMCDFVAAGNKKTVFLEMKTTDAVSMSFNNLKKHQVVEMNKAGGYKNVEAFFVFNFRKQGVTFAISADRIHDFYIAETPRKSFPVSWCEENGIKIEQTLKKTHYRYDVSPVLN